MEVLCNLDTYFLDFINGSGMTVLAILGCLKVLAASTSWAGDDKIISMLTGMVNSVKPGKKTEV